MLGAIVRLVLVSYPCLSNHPALTRCSVKFSLAGGVFQAKLYMIPSYALVRGITSCWWTAPVHPFIPRSKVNWGEATDRVARFSVARIFFIS